MEHEFDDELRQRLERTTPESAGFQLNKEALWRKIEQKQKKKSKLLLKWLSHTAAVAAGLLIGILLFQHKEVDVQPEKPSVVLQHSPEETLPSHDTLYIAKAASKLREERNKTQQPKSLLPANALHIARADSGSTIPPVAEHTPEVQHPESVAVHAQKVKILHIADIGNENLPTKSTPATGLALLQRYAERKNQAANGETFSMTVSHQIFANKTLSK